MKEKIYTTKKLGILMLLVIILIFAGSTALMVLGIIGMASVPEGTDPAAKDVAIFVSSFVIMTVAGILCAGFRLVNPNEAIVLTLFGKYKGTLKEAGFYYVNPFCSNFNPTAGTKLRQSDDVGNDKGGIKISTQGVSANGAVSKKISLKMMTLSNNKQKINDCLGNPIEISIAVIWKVVDTASAVFSVDNYKEYLSLQCDTALRKVVRLYPYDVAPNVDTTGDGVADEGSLRGSSDVVANRIKDEIQERVKDAGLEIVDARITYLAYAPEIAAAMLQRQQASAVVDARKLIVDGAVGMVQMALEEPEQEEGR